MEAENSVGETVKAKTAKERMEYVDSILDEYEKSCGLPSCKSPGPEDELNEYLTMDRNQMEKLTPENCAEISFRLVQFGFYLQRLYNREKARTIWAHQQLTEIIAKDVSSYDKYMKFDIKVATIIKDNSFAYSLQKIITYAEQRTQRLELIALSLKNLSDSISNVRRAKIEMIR